MISMGDDYKIKEIDGEKHLVEEGLFGEIDHGALHKNLDGSLETRNIIDENFRIRDNSLLSTGDKLEVEKSSGEKGTLEKGLFGDTYHYHRKSESHRPSPQSRRRSSSSREYSRDYNDDYNDDYGDYGSAFRSSHSSYSGGYSSSYGNYSVFPLWLEIVISVGLVILGITIIVALTKRVTIGVAFLDIIHSLIPPVALKIISNIVNVVLGVIVGIALGIVYAIWGIVMLILAGIVFYWLLSNL